MVQGDIFTISFIQTEIQKQKTHLVCSYDPEKSHLKRYKQSISV